MNNFVFCNPTEIIFGKGRAKEVGKKVKNYGNKLLLVTSLANYNELLSYLKAEGINVFVLSGITSNPRIDSVREGVKLVRENNIDIVLAFGGGSSIDCAKAIAICSLDERDPWEVFIEDKDFKKGIPLGVVLTHAATGSEMNPTAVITNWEKKQKYTIHNAIYPNFSILDPTLTYTVPKEHTVYGVIDIASHVFEQYFSKTEDTPIQDRWAEGIIKTLMENGEIVIKDPEDYNARANIMLSGTLALSSLLSMGKDGDFASHLIEHELSAIYDIPHGAGMAVIYPNWMTYVLTEGTAKFVQYTIRVHGIDPNGKSDKEIAIEGIKKTRDWFNDLGAPATLTHYGIGEDNFEEMAEKALYRNKKPLGSYKKLMKEDIINILKMCL
ncbi:MAG: iron-containing alcohol dehydrogenase [Actinobacteria bacterium]|nr:iron-containing alcohol dehydrogenase [Actinomycetota bacterium]